MREASAKVAVADSHYGNTANLIALAQRKIRAHVADMRNPRSAGIYPLERFAYQSKADCYKCPAGQILSRHHFLPSRGYTSLARRQRRDGLALHRFNEGRVCALQSCLVLRRLCLRLLIGKPN